jgi:hypothetical protein
MGQWRYVLTLHVECVVTCACETCCLLTDCSAVPLCLSHVRRWRPRLRLQCCLPCCIALNGISDCCCVASAANVAPHVQPDNQACGGSA